MKINIFSIHLTFWPDFYYFHGDFWHSKNVDVCSFFWGGRVLESVWFVHENVDIYGRPLNDIAFWASMFVFCFSQFEIGFLVPPGVTMCIWATSQHGFLAVPANFEL